MKPLRAYDTMHRPIVHPDNELPKTRKVLDEAGFLHTIAIERKRTERSKEPFLLMVLEARGQSSSGKSARILDRAATALQSCTRETDVVGWYREQRALAVMCTGIDLGDSNVAMGAILRRVSTALQEAIQAEQFNQINISFHLFPDDWDAEDDGGPANPALYPDLLQADKTKRVALLAKRTLDVTISAFLLTVCAPLFLLVAVAVKVSSKGPVLFKQQRVGQYGRSFTFLKFRSMRSNNDPRVHQEYVSKLIANQIADESAPEDGKRVYKLTKDPRVTAIGRFLRRTSLDELPQLLNVLKGDMSLVGPRPPIPYELAKYQTWHRRRLLGAKPGITGLWQIRGRSRVRFDDMVRMDLEYAMTWTPWLDLEILMQTPLAVVQGSGAC